MTESDASAYADAALPIGHGQTISQPYIVAYMTELVAPETGDKVLEIGPGLGPLTELLLTQAGEVYPTGEPLLERREHASPHTHAMSRLCDHG